MPNIGAYLFADTFRNLTKDELSILRGFGVNTIFSEADDYPADKIRLIQNEGLRFMGGLTCFHNTQLAQENPDYRPITSNGTIRPQMNWYIGIRPTHKDHQIERLDTVNRMLATYPLDGLWLDFIRWSMHWEVELREDTPSPLHTSFDPDTLAQFSTWTEIELPQKPISELTHWILTTQREPWIAFKCHIITTFVKALRTIKMQHSPHIPLAVNIVPASSSQRRDYLGQDIKALSHYVDVFSPMLYHHILGRGVTWIQDTLDEISSETDKPLIPFVQVSALGKDDVDFSTQEWEQVIQTVLDHHATDGLIAFTGDMLHKNQRGLSLRKQLNRS